MDGLKKRTEKTWTANELEILKENYNKLPNEELIKLFPDRSYISIYKKAWKMGFRKEKDLEFQNRSLARKGEKCCNWKGGRKITKKGYVLVYAPEHHRADQNGYVLEHIYIFEKETGIEVTKRCVIHHLDGNK